MPTPGKTWYHVTLGTHASWLPGDPRGFRDRKHRIHSGGDHRNPPPVGEHHGLHQYNQLHTGAATVIPADLRGIVGRKIADHLLKLGHPILVISVSGMHAHLLAELQSDRDKARHDITRRKQAAALAVRGQMNGKLWAKNMGLKPVNDRGHQINVYRYILKHRGEGAWVWDYRETAPDRDGG